MFKNITKKILLMLPILFFSFLIMSFLPFTKGEEVLIKKNVEEIAASPLTCVPYADWDPNPIEVDYNSQGIYFVSYYDFVGVSGAGCRLGYGCGYVDIDYSTSGFQCVKHGYGFTAYAHEGCPYITVVSDEPPTEGHYKEHSIDFRAMTTDGTYNEDWGGRTLHIYWRPFVPSGNVVPPCGNQ